MLSSKQISRIWLRLLTTIFLASSLFLLGTTWYYTPLSKSRPVTPENRAVIGRASNPADVAPSEAITASATFAPFLHIVPDVSGTALFISAGSPEVGGVVMANVTIGGGNHKGGGTMVYSNTLQAYVTTVVHPDLAPGASQEGTVSITTTLGLDTGAVDFNRAYVPAATTLSINSIDGNLQLTLVSTDTFPAEAYVAVVPSYAPPGPVPQGHQFVGSSYSVRASGAIIVADRPMSLHFSYNETTLAGADPHTLAIFAWDAFNQRWDNLGGTLFTTPEKYVSVATSRFTTYALMSTPAWRDKFDELSGLDLTQFNNVTVGGTPENRTLVLASTPGSGSAVSQPITPTTTFVSWGSLTFTGTVDPPTTTLTVDVLSLDGTEVLTGVASGANLAGLVDPVQYPSLRLRVNMASSAAGETPALEQWDLAWQTAQSPPPGNNKIYLPVVIKSGS